MDRRSLGAGLMALASSFVLMAGTASAHGTVSSPATESEATCTVVSQPSFTLQGEFSNTASAADVIEVSCNPLKYGTGGKVTVIASQLYSRCDDDVTWYIPNPYDVVDGRSVELTLDADGNANVALIAGPKCQAGETLISVHEDESPHESFVTSWSVLPPKETPEGLTALPASQVEDAESSGVATVIEAEFPGDSESEVRVASEELFRRCEVSPHLHWIEEDRTEVDDTSEVTEAIELDNDGNGFIVAVGDSSCEPGASLIEADLETKPFTTLTTDFTVVAPEPRV
jgi:hypothetical protein